MAKVSSAADVLENVRTARRRLVESGPRSVRSGRDFERVALPSADADVLRDLLMAERATTVIEVGLAYGSSALAIAEALVSGGLMILDDCNHLSVATAVRYFEVNTRWRPRPIDVDTRLRAFRLPSPRVEPSFEDFQPFACRDRSTSA